MSFLSTLRDSPAPAVAVEIAANRVSAAALEWRGGTPTVAQHATEPLPAGALVPALTVANTHDRAQVLEPLTVQFKDHHTAYGPIVSGPQGLSFIALRMITGNSAPTYLNQPGAREQLKPSKRRNLTSAPVKFSIEPLLQARKEVSWESLFDPADDGMSAQVVRLGPGMVVDGPDPKIASGYYVVVGNGSMVHDGKDMPLWSLAVVEPTEEKYQIRAGAKGLEALVLQYPRE